jgi:translocation and assembly module TamB
VTKRRWILSVVLGGLVLAVGAGALFAHRLLYTPEGLDLLLRQLGRLQTVKIDVTGAHGMLAGAISADTVVVDHEAVRIEARQLRVHPAWYGALTGHLSLDAVSVGKLEITLKQRKKPPESETHFLPAWLRLSLPEFVANDVGLTLASGSRFHVRQIGGSASISRWRIDLEPVAIDDPLGRVAGDVILRAGTPLGLRGKVGGQWNLPDERTYRFTAEVRGNLDELGTELALQQPARLAFSGNLRDLTNEAKVSGVLRMTDFDGSPWIAGGKLPPLSGSVALVASAASIGLGGTLVSPAIEGGQVRVRGGGTWQERQLTVKSLRLWLPRSQFGLTTKGTVDFRGESPLLALEGDWTALRWPLGAEPVVESKRGAYTLRGSLPYAFTARADVFGPSIPAADFSASGVFDTEKVVLEHVGGTVMKGRLQGSGQLAWVGTQPWQFKIAGTGLDVSQIRPEVQGRVNVAASIDGQGFEASSPWTARITSLSGTLFGRALTGRGEIAHRDAIYDLKQVRIGNGASNVDINGRYGDVMDLRWDANLQSLAIITPGLSGQLVSSGYAKGTAAKPEVTGEARIRNLRYGDIAIDKADATIDVDVSDRRVSRIEIRASDSRAGAVRFDEVTLRLSGLTGEHGLDIEIVSPGSPDHRLAAFRGRASASGSYDAATHTWSGNLTETRMTFPDDEARLLQPVALEFSPDVVRVAPLCIAAAESRLCVEGERKSRPESWRFIYSAQDWPLRRILRTLLGWQEFDGALQASGWAEKAPGHDWIGSTTMILDHPTLDVPRNKFRTDRIELGGGRLDLYAEPSVIRASVSLDVVDGTAVKGEAFADRRPGVDILASPLQGNLHGESAALTSLPVLVPEIDRSSGALDADLTLGGTLGEPRFNGAFRIRDGRFEFYRTNFTLSKVDLDGNFIGDELTFAGRGETSKGPVTLDGRFNWPEGVMTGAMHLKGENLLVADTPEYRVIASPDLAVRAGSEGYDVEGDIVVPAAKISPKDLSTSVSTSADEKVIDVEVQDTGPSTAQRIRSRIRVVIGDNVRVESFGLKARLGGEVIVLTKPDDVARGLGAINVVEGQYKAFGQDVKITKGKLSYNNTPLGEPLLELTAERTIKDEDVTVTVNVRGSLAKPFITLTSTPAMASNEALSYLLTGHSLDTLQTGQATNVNKAAESLAMSGGGLLLGGLGTKLGLDEVSLERTDTEDTSVTLGKFLSPKLFVSYGVSIAEAINTIKLRYTLNERWSLKAEAGLEQGADIEYKIER